MKPNLLKKVKSQKILAEGYDKSDIPQIFELFKSKNKSTHELAMQMLYGKDDNGVPNFNVQDVEKYARKLFWIIMGATGLKNWKDLFDIGNLDLGIKALKDIPIGLQWLTNLHSLELGDNKLTQIDDNTFEGLNNLEWLALNRNKLTRISDNAFAGLTNLRRLYLNKNQLTQVSPNIFIKLSNLEYLDLKYNPIPIEQIENLRKQLPNVQILF